MQIKVNLKIFLFLIIFIITRQIKIYAILMLFALIHELGHLIMGIIIGFKPESISIIPTGFTIRFKAESENYNRKIKKANILALKQIIIALAGPITNFLIIISTIIYYKITQNSELFSLPLEMIIYSNILILIFNLIPICPLDGGRILKEAIHIFLGLYQSYVITNRISKIVIVLLTAISSIAILKYKNIAILIIIIYLWFLFLKENKNTNNKIKIWNTYNSICSRN